MAHFFHLEDATPMITEDKSANAPLRQRIAVNDKAIELSRTPLEIPKEEEEEVVATVGFHRKDYDLAVTSFHDKKGFPSMPLGYSERRNTRAGKRRKKKSEDSRLATCFPTEIMHMILRQSSFEALCRFRLTNSYSKEVVEDMPEFQNLLKHGSTAARAALETRSAAGYSIGHMLSILHDPHCWHCGEFGNWVFLPWFVRICFDHFDSERSERMGGMFSNVTLLSTTSKATEMLMDRSGDKLAAKVVPGKYGIDQTDVGDDTWVLAARPPRRLHWYEGPNGEFEDDDVVFLPDRSHRAPYEPSLGKGHYASQKEYVVRLATAAAFPYVDPTTGFADRGLSCAGCNSSRSSLINSTNRPWMGLDSDDSPWLNWSRGSFSDIINHVWSRKGFLAHVRVCQKAQRLWAQEKKGLVKKRMKVDPFVEKGGHFADYKEKIPVAVRQKFWYSHFHDMPADIKPNLKPYVGRHCCCIQDGSEAYDAVSWTF